MKDKIIARLKSKFSGVNLSNARLNAFADKLAPKITDESQIDVKLDELNDVYSFADMAKEDDRIRTLEANQKPKPEPPKPTPPPTDPKDPPKPADDAPEWAKGLIEQNKLMAQKLEQLESGKTQESNQARLLGILKEKNVPPAYYEVAVTGRTFKDATEVDAFATQLTEAYGKYHQEQVNAGLKDQPAPVLGIVKDPAKDVSPDMQEFIKNKKASQAKTA